MRVAITGARGRLGRALVDAFSAPPGDHAEAPEHPWEVVSTWSRPDYDLDDLKAADRLVRRDRPEVIVHAAAWTDVDGCARHPDLAKRRNADATEALARACLGAASRLVLISTNEVFDGRRADGRGYTPDDRVGPLNAYGDSKLEGERAARDAFSRAGHREQLAIIRTAWLYGPPGDDFPTKILAAAERASHTHEPLRVVSDEIGSPTFAPDLARAIAGLLANERASGVLHVVNAGAVSRADWAREILRQAGVDQDVEEIASRAWPRASTPPAWAVLASDVPLRPWSVALAEYLATFRQAAAPATG
jgi:dTDP-4-dehydrorhamnose reductase